MRKSLVFVGLSVTALGLFFAALPALRGGEKTDAIFLLGHWFDIIWEVAIPCVSLGVLLCAAAPLRSSLLYRQGGETQSSEGT